MPDRTPAASKVELLRRCPPLILLGVLAQLVHATLELRRAGFVQAGWWDLAVRCMGRHYAWSDPYGIPAFIVVGALAVFADRRLLPGRALMVQALEVAALTLLFFRRASGHGLPPSPATPAFSGLAEIAVNGGIFALGLAAAVAATALGRRSLPGPALAWSQSGWTLLAFLLTFPIAGLLAERLPTPGPTDLPRIALISLDTLRADRVGCFGHARDTTSSLDGFAREAVRFAEAASPYPFTLTAHGTMLSGLDPARHGAVPIGPRVDDRLPLFPDVQMVAELFRAAGYVTAAFVDSSCLWMHPRYGFARGFGVYRPVRGTIDDKNRELAEFLRDVGDRPLFLFLHCFDIHSDGAQLPYDCEPDDRGTYTRWYQGKFDGTDPADPKVRASEYLRRLNDTRSPLGETEIRYISDLYDEGIRSTDRGVGTTLGMLREKGFMGRGAILVTADHGEEFREHGRFLHDEQLFEESVHVPVLLRLPQGAHGGIVVTTPVALADVAPTLAAIASLSFTAAQGRSLLSLVDGEPGAGEPDAVPVFLGATADAEAVRVGGWKLVRTGETHALYDLAADPGERNDLAGTREEVERGLLRLLAQRRHENEVANEHRARRMDVELTGEERRRMNQIGYK